MRSLSAGVDVYPAVDLRAGRVVQLVGGDFDRETVHGDDPAAVARRFEEAGAPWIHVVDLDAARTGHPTNRDAVAAICDAVAVPVQAGGGVRTADHAAALADVGVARVVIGTAAVTEPGLVAVVAAHQPVAVGLDVRGDEVAVHGWTEGSGRSWRDVLTRLDGAGADAVVVTQIAGEGRMGGPDLAGLREVLAATDLQVIASGGVGTLDHVEALAALEVDGRRRLAGVIVGTAIYEGRLDLEAAVASTGCRPPG